MITQIRRFATAYAGGQQRAEHTMNVVTEDNVQSIKSYYDKYTIIRYVNGATTMIRAGSSA